MLQISEASLSYEAMQHDDGSPAVFAPLIASTMGLGRE